MCITTWHPPVNKFSTVSWFNVGPKLNNIKNVAGCPYPCGPWALASARRLPWQFRLAWPLMRLLILQPFAAMPAMGLGGNKGPDPFPLTGTTLKGLLQFSSLTASQPASPLPGPVSLPSLTGVIPEHPWVNFLLTHLISEPDCWLLYCGATCKAHRKGTGTHLCLNPASVTEWPCDFRHVI